MNPALLILLGLQLKGWVRYFFRNLRTVKGALLALVGLAVLLPWFLSLLFLPPKNVGLAPETIRIYGPPMLLLYCVFNVVFSSGEKAIYFSPAEINFLFSGPFTRRQILAYKILMTIMMGLPTTLFLAVMLRIHAASFLSAYVGLFLMFLFMSLLTMALNLIGVTIGASLYSRVRKLILAALLLLLAGVAGFVGLPRWSDLKPEELLKQLNDSTVWHLTTWPLSTFFEAFLAERIWPDLVYWAGLALLVNLVLLGIVFWLDANYLETTAAFSARTYARIQKLRSGNIWAGVESGGKVRFHPPMLPYWGGIGPILWQKLTVAIRGMSRLVILFVIFGVCLGAPMFGALSDNQGGAPLLTMAAGMTLWLTIMLTSLVPFDFRGDIDRMAVLKSLPISAWRLSLGQLLTPTLLVSCLQWFVLLAILTAGLAGVGAADLGERRFVAMLVLTGTLFVFPFNFLLFGLENLLFLLFPARVMASQPGDFQAVGRNVLFVFAKLISLVVVVGIAAATGVVIYWVSRNPWVSLAGAWMVLTISAALTVPLVALAFTWFDVGRDTPP